jgi:uncharacterized protein
LGFRNTLYLCLRVPPVTISRHACTYPFSTKKTLLENNGQNNIHLVVVHCYALQPPFFYMSTAWHVIILKPSNDCTRCRATVTLELKQRIHRLEQHQPTFPCASQLGLPAGHRAWTSPPEEAKPNTCQTYS